LSAQRAIVRHGRGDSPIGRGLVSFAKEVVCTPLQPGLFAQAVGRLAGLKTRPSDLKFAAAIEKVKRTKSAIEKTGLNVFPTDVAASLLHHDSDATFKRAA
jgi:hypothetical protein